MHRNLLAVLRDDGTQSFCDQGVGTAADPGCVIRGRQLLERDAGIDVPDQRFGQLCPLSVFIDDGRGRNVPSRLDRLIDGPVNAVENGPEVIILGNAGIAAVNNQPVVPLLG